MKNFCRNCPKCKNEICYTLKHNRDKLQKQGKLCKKCISKELEIKLRGENNPFYGKKHTNEFKKRLSKERKGKSFKNRGQIKKGQKLNPNTHLGIKPQLINKYGEVEGNKRWELFINKQKTNNSGSKNAMFGKPSPNGSGNGWSGWYKNWFFRSLLELSYMINVIEKQDLMWESGEKQKYKIPYIDYLGNNRNYFPDFVIDNTIIECKPKKLHNAPSITSKVKGALEFCKINGYKYEIVEPIKLIEYEILELYKNNLIKFMKKYDKKFKRKYGIPEENT